MSELRRKLLKSKEGWKARKEQLQAQNIYEEEKGLLYGAEIAD